jgi:hypothetical protein
MAQQCGAGCGAWLAAIAARGRPARGVFPVFRDLYARASSARVERSRPWQPRRPAGAGGAAGACQSGVSGGGENLLAGVVLLGLTRIGPPRRMRGTCPTLGGYPHSALVQHSHACEGHCPG